MIDLSIIIINFNTKKLIIDCLRSLEKEQSKINKEIIVIDNGSTDGSLKALQKIKIRDANIKLIANQKNLGFAKAANQGIKKAQGEYLFFLNSDTQVKKDTLGKLISFIKKKSKTAIVGPKLLNLDGSVQASVFHFPTFQRAVREFWLKEKKAFSKYVPSADEAVEVEAVAGAAMLAKKKLLKRVGFFNEKYFMYYEDLDLCRRLAKIGCKIYYLPSAAVVHHHGASGKNSAPPAEQWRRLIPSSKIYHGTVKHYIMQLIIWWGLKWQKAFGKN